MKLLAIQSSHTRNESTCITGCIATAIYIGMVVCMKCSHLCCSSCLCTLSASNTCASIPCMWTLIASSFIPTSFLFLQKVFNDFLFMLFFSFKNCYVCHPHTCSWCIILACAPTNGVQQLVHSAPSVFPAKNRRSEVTALLKRSSKGPSSENFLATGSFLKHNTYCITALGCLKKEDEQFWF